MANAVEARLGVNYFDDMLSETFSNKRGNASAAVVMASLKAIEALLCALKATRKTCLDPTLVVHAQSARVALVESYDTRRLLYPRARIEAGDGLLTAAERRADADQLEQYSFSGAIYKIFMSILPLLRSARHPRLHLLNLLITALPELLEKGVSAADTDAQELDKRRLRRILEVLGTICRPVPSEHWRYYNLIDPDLELTDSMTWKIVELVVRLLRLYPPSRYCVEKLPHHADANKNADDNGDILVPRMLWEAVRMWVASPMFSEVAAKEWKDESLVEGLTKIDKTIPAFIHLKHSSQQDARMIIDFVEFAKAHREKLSKFDCFEKPSFVNLQVAQKAIQIRCAFDTNGSEAIADATLLVIWSALKGDNNDETGHLIENDIRAIQFILCDLLHGKEEAQKSDDLTVTQFFCGLMDVVNIISSAKNAASADLWRQFVTEVLCEPKFLTILLFILARNDEETNGQMNNAALWEILRFALNQLALESSDKLVQLKTVIPLLQHLAYIEPSEKSSPEQRLTQPQLAEVINRLEASLPNDARYILISRCLLHESSYIRKAAASGIIQIVSQMNPAALDWITQKKEIRDDPFGCSFVRDDKMTTLETTLMESPLPVIRSNDYQPSENELSSQLTKLAHLRKVISGTSSAFENMKEAAFKELVLLIENAPVELFALLEELNRLTDFMELLRPVFQFETDRSDALMVQQALLLLRTLLLRSRLLRSAMQRDSSTMELLMPYIFHSSAAIRTQMYYVLLLLTCAVENFVPEGAPVGSFISNKAELIGEAALPDILKSTFGLYSNRWTRCFIVTCSLKDQLLVSYALLTNEADSSWFREVKAIIQQTPSCKDETYVELNGTNSSFSSLIDAEYTHIARSLREAPSHGKCLNALYHLMTLCGAWYCARKRFVEEWEADFERYLSVPPKSERDEVIIGSIVNILSVLFCSMTRGEQLRALVVIKRNILPLLKQSQSKVLSLQVARLLLNMSGSKIANLFLSLAADTDIIAIICTKYSAIYATEPVLHTVMLEVLLRFAFPMDNNSDLHLSTASREKICKRLAEMLSPLLTIVCRHRVPGSFLERSVVIVGSQCMIAILRTLPRDFLLAGDNPLLHTDTSILLDGSWASRLLFDHVSPIRELGFRVIEHNLSSDPPSSRLLEMAFETSSDDTESDAVRAAASSVMAKEILRWNEYSLDQQTAIVEAFRGLKFAGRTLSLLSKSLKDNKILVCTASAFARLVRALYVENESLAPQFGNIRRELQVAGEEYDMYPLLIQVRTSSASGSYRALFLLKMLLACLGAVSP
ncbi:unnamed protein product [Phytophthora fragariaefolia]|uniref:Unnamed protein product n=1 Tax=Phytophthora fragariaefolia TaxID=1490495 RepID=A0A9W7CRE7_9STRA|nr:unnamed protein product [Phytophthora fragariaefolia]